MKCTQCGCTDLVATYWPHEYVLKEVKEGISGETSVYDMDEIEYADVYICTQCGHYEFFNKKLADAILEDRKAVAEISKKIDEIDRVIDDLGNKIKECKNNILQCNEELENLDITVRKSNELYENIDNLSIEIKKTEKEMSKKQSERKKLEKELESYE